MQSANQRFFICIKYPRLGSFLHQKLRKPLYTHLSLQRSTIVTVSFSVYQTFYFKGFSGFWTVLPELCISPTEYDHITPLLMELHWLPVEQRINFKIVLITYKALNGQAPSYISYLLSYYRPARSLRSSTQNLLGNPCYNLKNYGVGPLQWLPHVYGTRYLWP